MIEALLEAERAMTVGMLDHAERVYRGVVDTDPRNSIAVVGLARVALERGQDAEALQLARRALRIDGENVAAQRLVTRLEEVLRMRGVPLPPEGTAPGPAAPVSEARSVTSPGPVSQLRRASTAASRTPGSAVPRAPSPEPPASASEPPASASEPAAATSEPPAISEPSPRAVTPAPRPMPPVTTSARRGLVSRLLRRD